MHDPSDALSDPGLTTNTGSLSAGDDPFIAFLTAVGDPSRAFGGKRHVDVFGGPELLQKRRLLGVELGALSGFVSGIVGQRPALFPKAVDPHPRDDQRIVGASDTLTDLLRQDLVVVGHGDVSCANRRRGQGTRRRRRR